MDQPSMSHLDIDQVPPDFDLITAQRSLQKRVFEEGAGTRDCSKPATTKRELLASFRMNQEATLSEWEETRDRLPWKEWRAAHRASLDDPLDDELMLEIRFELVDELHFLANRMIAAGFTTWDQVEAYYFAKNRENFARQDRGY